MEQSMTPTEMNREDHALPADDSTPEPQPTKSKAQVIAEIKDMQDRLARAEAKSGPSGAKPFAPPQMLLDASDVQALHPDKRVRWVNVVNTQKAQRRQAEGYERIPAAEGGRQVGNLALFAIPRADYERKVAAQAKLNRDRLDHHNREIESAAEQLSKILKDQHGVSIRPEDFLLGQ